MLKLIRTPQKYVQGKDALNEFAKYAKDYGNRFLFVSSKRGLNDCKEKIEKSFEGTDAFRKYEIFSGISSNGEIERMRKIVVEKKSMQWLELVEDLLLILQRLRHFMKTNQFW